MLRPFTLHRPDTTVDASRLLGALGSATVYCGGTEILQVMKMGLARYDHLVDLKGITELAGITAIDGRLRIGAAATHREIERSPLVAQRYPSLAAMARHIANVRVRNVGTIGGNLCFAEPHSDPATYLLACDGAVELADDAARRTVAFRDFVTAPFTTARRPTEILVALHLPPLAPGTAIAYRKIALVERPTASVACRVTLRDGVVREALVVVGCVGDVPTALDEAAAPLVGAGRDAAAAIEEAGRRAEARCEAWDDDHASAEYKRHLAGVLVRRAAAAALFEAHRA